MSWLGGVLYLGCLISLPWQVNPQLSKPIAGDHQVDASKHKFLQRQAHLDQRLRPEGCVWKALNTLTYAKQCWFKGGTVIAHTCHAGK